MTTPQKTYEELRDAEEIVEILVNGKTIIVDKEDLHKFEGLNLAIKPSNGKFYVNCRKTINGTRINKLLHRIIMGDIHYLHVDHINGNSLDNRKSNLRFVNHSMNMRNQKIRNDSKLPRYIFKDRKSFYVHFRKRVNGEKITVCRELFSNLLDAVKFRDKWIIENDWFGLREFEFNRARKLTLDGIKNHKLFEDYEAKIAALETELRKLKGEG